jgi:ubiquinone/menaquinone biosynthesis C-methylase UbiE
MHERTYDDFDEFAENYRNIHSENIKISGTDSYYFAEMKVRLLKQYETDSTLNILDVGCGDGATELYFQQYFPNWKIDGIDISSESIKFAQRRDLTNSTFQVYDSFKFPFKEDSFDRVFIAGVLHHIAFNQHNLLVKEIFRVLKKNGKLFLYEHNPLNPITRHLVNTCVFDKNAKLLYPWYTKKILQRNKLKPIFHQYIIFFPRTGILSKLIFLEKYLQWLPIGGQYFCSAIKRD